jgi:hypothetical protein
VEKLIEEEKTRMALCMRNRICVCAGQPVNLSPIREVGITKESKPFRCVLYAQQCPVVKIRYNVFVIAVKLDAKE